MEKTKRNHPIWILKKMVFGIRQIIIPFAFVFITSLKKLNLFSIIAILLGIVVIYGILALISWKNYTYSFDGQILWVKKGFLVKNRQGLAMEQVTTINTTQSLIDRLLKLQNLKIDTSSINKGNEVSLLISPIEVETLRAYFQKPSPSPESEEVISESAPPPPVKFPTFTVKTRELIIYAIASNGFLAGIVFFISLLGLFDSSPEFTKKIEDSMMSFLGDLSLDALNQISWWKVLLIVIVFLFVYVFFSLIVSMIVAYIKYFQFQVTRNENDILIEYGLFEKKKYILPIHKVRAMYISYGLLGQFLKLSTLKIESIGYGDEKGEAAILYPIASEARRKEIVKALLPDFNFEPTWIRSPKRAFSNYIISNSLLVTLVAIILSFTWDYGVWTFALVVFFGFCGLQSYKKSAISMDALKLVVQGGALSKTITILPLDGIQSFSESQNLFQKRKKLQNLSFAYQSNLPAGARTRIRFLDQAVASEISAKIYTCILK